MNILLDTILVQDCFEKNNIEALRIYQYLRYTFGNNAGFFSSTDKHKIKSELNLSESTYYRYLSKLKKLGWLVRFNKSYKFISIHQIRKALGLVSRSCTKINLEHLSCKKTFKAFCISACITNSILHTNRNRITNKKTVVKARGQIAQSTISNILSISKSTVSQLVKLATKKGYLNRYCTYDKSFGTYPVEQIYQVRKFFPDVANRIVALNGKCVLRTTDIIFTNIKQVTRK